MRVTRLSQREQQICSDRVGGLTYKAIADKRQLSISTVKTHLSRVFVKRGVTSSLDLQRKPCPAGGCPAKHSVLLIAELHTIQETIHRLLHATNGQLSTHKAWPTYKPLSLRSRRPGPGT
jgi:DNA-binding CsgD family transcriptional regulator